MQFADLFRFAYIPKSHTIWSDSEFLTVPILPLSDISLPGILIKGRKVALRLDRQFCDKILTCLTPTPGSVSINSRTSSSWSLEHTCVSNPLKFSLTLHHCRRECQVNSLSENPMLNIGHSHWLIIVSCMKRYVDSPLSSDSSGPTGWDYQSVSIHWQQTNDLASQPFSKWIEQQVNYHPMPDQYTL